MTHGEEFTDPVDGTVWNVDIEFLASRWTCIWDRGCEGILDHRAAALGQGCCSVGAQLLDEEEAMRVAALAATLDHRLFQLHDVAAAGGVFADGDRRATLVVDGACVFLNRPGFEGGAGCALHLGALADGDSPLEWKPAVCWQLPLKVERHHGGHAVLRRWRRDDWGEGGATMAWCCTEEPEPLIGTTTVAESEREVLEALVGPEVAVEIGRRVAARDS